MSDKADSIAEIAVDIKDRLQALNIDNDVKSEFVTRIDKFVELVDEIDDTGSLDDRDEAEYLFNELRVIHNDVMDYIEEVAGMNKG